MGAWQYQGVPHHANREYLRLRRDERWWFCLTSGRIVAPGGDVIGPVCYSGMAELRSPLDTALRGGPIPPGHWRMSGMRNSLKTGIRVIDLVPGPNTYTSGRSAFQVHGDSKLKPGNASMGCIIAPMWLRLKMWNEGHHQLVVVRNFTVPFSELDWLRIF